MNRESETNETFLRNLYRRGPFQGHAYLAIPSAQPWWEHPHGEYTVSNLPVSNWVPSLVQDYQNQIQWTQALQDHAVPLVRILTGTHIYAAAFGAGVHQYPDNNPVAVPFIQSAEEADRLIEPDIWKSPTLYRVFELAEAIRRELGPEVFIGPPDCQTGFDTACLIWDKTSILCAMADPEEKEAVKRLADKCARVFKKFQLALRKEFPNLTPCHCPGNWAPPELGPWTSNDECGAVSTEMFEEFMLPELIDLSVTFGGMGMHCCADANHQLSSFKKIPNFYGFNRIPEKGGDFTPLLEHLHGPEAPVHTLWMGDASTVQHLVRVAPEGTRFVFVRVGGTLEEARTWLAAVQYPDGSQS